MRNTIKDVNLALNHDPSYHFNIKINWKYQIFDTTKDEAGTLYMSKLGT